MCCAANVNVNNADSWSARGEGSISLYEGGDVEENRGGICGIPPLRPAGPVSGSLKFLLSSLLLSTEPQFLPRATCWLMSTCSASCLLPPLALCYLLVAELTHSSVDQEDKECFPFCHLFFLLFSHAYVITINPLWWHGSRQSSLTSVPSHRLSVCSFSFSSPFSPPTVSARSFSSQACTAVFTGVSLLFKSEMMKQTK